MEKKDALTQYNRFISQLRTEVGQMFWLYNFFFVFDSALLGVVFFKKLDGLSLLTVTIAGSLFSFYWNYIMEEKNKWRKKWLDRIKEIEKILHLPIEFKMWPEDGKPPENDKPGGGLWETMLWLPKALVVGWAIIFIIFSSFGISSFIYLSIVRF